MKGKVFLVEWNPPTAEARARQIRKDGWEVEFECEDVHNAFKRIKDSLPNVVVIDLAKKPSYSRQIAMSLLDSKETRNIPLVFIDGDDEDVEFLRKDFPNAVFTVPTALLSELRLFIKKENIEEKLKRLLEIQKRKNESFE